MIRFIRLVKTITNIFLGVSAFATFMMVILTCIDVFGRYFFNKPLEGSYELISFFSAIAISSALAYTTLNKGHISVSFIIQKFPDLPRKIFVFLTNFLVTIFLVLLAWKTFEYANDIKKQGELSMTLKLPFYYFLYFNTLAFIAGALASLKNSIHSFFKVF